MGKDERATSSLGVGVEVSEGEGRGKKWGEEERERGVRWSEREKKGGREERGGPLGLSCNVLCIRTGRPAGKSI